MISGVTFERTTFRETPAKFEAGTGTIADAIGLGSALDYVTSLGQPIIEQYERQLLEHAITGIRTVPGLRLIGTAPDKASVLTFVLAAHHCAQPILRRYGLDSAVRPSLAMYNTAAEVDLLITALRRLAANASRC
jgi:cysteine desulfurase/selenocysteine lyase